MEVENFFQLRFKVEKDRSKLDGVKLNRISREDYQMLLVEFEEKEVKEEKEMTQLMFQYLSAGKIMHNISMVDFSCQPLLSLTPASAG